MVLNRWEIPSTCNRLVGGQEPICPIKPNKSAYSFYFRSIYFCKMSGFTAPFNNMQTLANSTQLTVSCFAAVNHLLIHSKVHVRGLWLVDFDPLVCFFFFHGPLVRVGCRHNFMIDGSEKRNCKLGFELHSSRVIERRSNKIFLTSCETEQFVFHWMSWSWGIASFFGGGDTRPSEEKFANPRVAVGTEPCITLHASSLFHLMNKYHSDYKLIILQLSCLQRIISHLKKNYSPLSTVIKYVCAQDLSFSCQHIQLHLSACHSICVVGIRRWARVYEPGKEESFTSEKPYLKHKKPINNC